MRGILPTRNLRNPNAMNLPPTAELVNPNLRRGPFEVALFDFDGTLSLIREGWPRVMVDLMMDRLRAQDLVRDPAADAAHVEGFVMALNGHPTMRQMERFAEEVVTRGGTPARPVAYLAQYIDNLIKVVRGRWDAIETGRVDAAEWVVPNAHGILGAFQQRNVPLFVASGTDIAHVSREVELLKLAPFVGDSVSAPKDNDPTFRKRDVIERAMADLGVGGEVLIGFGDGVVETQEVKRAGGVAVGVASVEAGARGVNASKRQTLIAAGADIIIPDYEHAEQLLAWLWGG